MKKLIFLLILAFGLTACRETFNVGLFDEDAMITQKVYEPEKTETDMEIEYSPSSAYSMMSGGVSIGNNLMMVPRTTTTPAEWALTITCKEHNKSFNLIVNQEMFDSCNVEDMIVLSYYRELGWDKDNPKDGITDEGIHTKYVTFVKKKWKAERHFGIKIISPTDFSNIIHASKEKREIHNSGKVIKG